MLYIYIFLCCIFKLIIFYRQKIIEEERVRMLKEHVKNLIGYLPKGVLKSNDLPHLGNDVMDEYLQHYGNTIFNIS